MAGPLTACPAMVTIIEKIRRNKPRILVTAFIASLITAASMQTGLWGHDIVWLLLSATPAAAGIVALYFLLTPD